MADGTLTTLNPALPLLVGGERVMLRPVLLSELPQVARVQEGWNLMKATGGQVLDAEAWEDFLQLLAAAAGKPVAWLEGLTEAQFEELFCLVIGINRDLWKESEGPASGEEMTWAEILQSLVEHGHAFESTQRYTVDQARTFLLQGFRREREALAQAIQAAGFAMADGKSVQKVVKELRRG